MNVSVHRWEKDASRIIRRQIQIQAVFTNLAHFLIEIKYVFILPLVTNLADLIPYIEK